MHSTMLTPESHVHATSDFRSAAAVTKRTVLRSICLSLAAMLGFAAVLGALVITPEDIDELRHPWLVSIQELAVNKNGDVSYAFCRCISKSSDTRVRHHLSRQPSGSGALDPVVVVESVNPVQACSLSDGIIVAEENGTLWRFRSNNKSASLLGRHGSERVWRMRCSLDERLLMAWGNRCTVWDIHENTLLADYPGDFTFALPAADRKCFYCDSADDLIELDLFTGQRLRLVAATGPILGATLSPDGRRLAAMGVDRRIRMIDVDNSTILWTQSINSHTASGPVAHLLASPVLLFSPDGLRCVCAHQLRGPNRFGLSVWQSGNGALEFVFAAHANRIIGARFADAERLYTWGADYRLCQWRLERNGARLISACDTTRWRTLE